MAKLPTSDECVRHILDVFGRLHSRAGESLNVRNILDEEKSHGRFRSPELTEALQLCVQQGLIKQVHDDVYALTEAGYTAI
jgi:hypothetical protein